MPSSNSLSSILLWSDISDLGSTSPMVDSANYPNSYMECLGEFVYLCFQLYCHPLDGVIQHQIHMFLDSQTRVFVKL